MEQNKTFINCNRLNSIAEETANIYVQEIGGEKVAKKKTKKPAFAEETTIGEEPAVAETPVEAPVETAPETPAPKVRKPTVLGSRGGGMYAKLTTYLTGLVADVEVTRKDIETALGAHSGYVQMCIAKAVADGLIVKEGKAKFKVVHPVAS